MRFVSTYRDLVASGFSETASDYDGAVRFNIEGAQRLVMAIPPGDYNDVLDVGCGTGWATQALIDRFSPARVTGVDPSEGMLEQFEAKLGAIDGIDVALVQAGVEDMPVAEASFDLAICSMAYHWFPRRWDAAKAIAQALKPGGVVAILCSGKGGEKAYRDLAAVPDPIDLVNVFRAGEFIPAIVDECIRLGLKKIWMQEGAVNEEAAGRARAAGMTVVMDRCILRDYTQLMTA